jgi:hypothetical protein
MRAWKMTAGLAVAALLAAFFAPRLLGSSPVPESYPPPRELEVPIAPASRVAEVPKIAEVPQVPVRRSPEQVDPIPELQNPLQLPVVPTTPDPTLEENWLDMVDCGMG